VGRGRCRFNRFFSGSELLKDDFLVVGALMELSEPNAPVILLALA
jgi:hypothetical protein